MAFLKNVKVLSHQFVIEKFVQIRVPRRIFFNSTFFQTLEKRSIHSSTILTDKIVTGNKNQKVDAYHFLQDKLKWQEQNEKNGKMNYHKKTDTNERTLRMFQSFYSFLRLPPPDKDMLVYARDHRDMDTEKSMKKLLKSFASENLVTVQDRIDSWKIIASVSTVKKIDWKNKEVLKILYLVSSSVPTMTWPMLKDCVRYLSMTRRYKGPSKPKILDNFRQTLDIECGRRFQLESKHLYKSFVLSNNNRNTNYDDVRLKREDVFNLAYTWTRVGMVMDSDNFALSWSSRYTKVLTEFFLAKDMLPKLTNQELVFIFFLMGVHRQFPRDWLNKFNGNADRGFIEIPDFVTKHLVRIMNVLSYNEIGTICHALHKCKIRLHPGSDQLNDMLIMSLANMSKDDVLSHEIDLSSISKLLKKRGTPNFKAIAKLMINFGDHLRHLPPLSKIRLTNIISDGSVMNYQPFLHSFAMSIKEDMNQLRLKDVEMVTHLLFHMNYTENKSIYQDIKDVIDKCDRSDPRSGRILVYICSHLVKFGILPRQVSQIFDAVNSSQALKLASNEMELLEEGVKAISTLSFAQDGSSLLDREIVRSKSLHVYALKNIAEMDWNIELDFPQYNGPRLDPALRRKFLTIYPPDDLDSSNEKLKSEILLHLTTLVGPEVCYGKIMPHSTTRDIFFCMSIRNKKKRIAMKVPSEFPSDENITSITPDHSLGQWIAVIVPKKDNIDGHGNPLGAVDHKIRQLENLGYKVVMLRHYSYATALRNNNVIPYLVKYIFSENKPAKIPNKAE